MIGLAWNERLQGYTVSEDGEITLYCYILKWAYTDDLGVTGSSKIWAESKEEAKREFENETPYATVVEIQKKDLIEEHSPDVNGVRKRIPS